MIFLLLALELVPNFCETCTVGWFGSRCRFKCHCTDDKCMPGGDCSSGVGCKPGWFGPACQYKDLASETQLISLAPDWLVDADDSTCNPDPVNTTEVTVSLTSSATVTVAVSWMRLVSKSIVHADEFAVTINRNESCATLRTSRVNQKRIDLYCGWDKPLQLLNLRGAGVKTLCSLYISMGRNVALRQDINQTGIMSAGFDARSSVDGQPSGNCSISNTFGDQRPTWFINFSTPHIVHTIHVTAGGSSVQVYCLSLYNDLGQQVFEHFFMFPSRSTATVTVLTQHHVVSATIQPHPTTLHHRQELSLCEVEMWGENVCPNGNWGLECEHPCACAAVPGRPGEMCSSITGACLFPCPQGVYGLFCLLKCPANCWHACEPESAKCYSCKAGYQGERCDQVCDAGLYGPNCAKTCPDHCANNTCNPFNGNCFTCEPGFVSRHCKDCDPATVNSTCALSCDAECLTCEVTPHTCTSCVPDYQGSRCLPVQSLLLGNLKIVPSYGMAITISIVFFATMGGTLMFVFVSPRLSDKYSTRRTPRRADPYGTIWNDANEQSKYWSCYSVSSPKPLDGTESESHLQKQSCSQVHEQM